MVRLFKEDSRDEVRMVLEDVDGCVVVDLNVFETNEHLANDFAIRENVVGSTIGRSR
jgi:hypothetical protein